MPELVENDIIEDDLGSIKIDMPFSSNGLE
jgi:hypothetical protein